MHHSDLVDNTSYISLDDAVLKYLFDTELDQEQDF